MNYEPDIYSYTYLLSPATTWKEFGTLDIILNTPYYITVSSVEGYVKTENGYQWSLSGLPEGELEFTLCTEPNPRAPMTATSVFETLLNQIYNSLFSITIIVVVVVLLVIAVIMFLRMKKRKVTKDDN